MCVKRLLFWHAVLVWAFLIPNTCLVAQFHDLAKWVPESANAIVMVRAKDIFDSDISKKERWKVERMSAFKSGAAVLPPTTKRFLMAAQLDYEFMEPIWEATVFENSDATIDIVDVSKRLGGNLDSIAGNEAIVLPNDAFLVKIDGQTIVSMSPANRQLTSRWVRSQKTATMRLSDYLSQAVEFADNNAHIIAAFDFQDTVNPDHIKQRLASANIVPKDDLDVYCSTLASIKGLTMGVTVNDKITGSIKIDFSQDPNVLASSGKEILIHALKDNGLMIDDIEEWPMQIKSKHLLLIGPLSPMGLRQIGTLIEHPLTAEIASGTGSIGDEVDMKTRSMQYFHSIQHLSDELRNKQAKGLETYARWFDRYARQIDNLSVLNVDPAVLNYGRYVADGFRDITGLLLGAEYDKVVSRQAFSDTSSARRSSGGYAYRQTYNGYRRYYGEYKRNYSQYGKNTRRRQIAGAQARMKGANQAREVMREIDTETAKVRKEMSQKYQIDF